MRTEAAAHLELFSTSEIARAARVAEPDVRALITAGRVVTFRGFVAPADAVALVRVLTRQEPRSAIDRSPLRLIPERKRRAGAGLVLSGLLHAAFVLALVSAGLASWFSNETEEDIPTPAHLVFLIDPGPGGGGGGGGLQMTLNPPVAERKAPEPAVKKKTPSPVVTVKRPPPPVRSTARLARPIEPPRIEPSRIETPPVTPALVVQAPVRSIPANPVDTAGLLASRSNAMSQGTGTDGGVGSGRGTGSGEGEGSGIGAGTGGGTGGGPYHPGSGIEPPRLLTEVRPVYTDDARRRGIEGDVALEVVVARDGRVSNVRVLRGLGAGLDQKAIDAVRQWRFAPARRQGTPVDVVVQVSVGFSLR